MISSPLLLGTRGSALALWQANHVAGLLRAVGVAVELVILKTSGDLRQEVPLAEMAGKGVFVKELEAALLAGAIHLAVHSAKDLPSTDAPGLTLAAFCERADVRDAVVSPCGTLAALPSAARVATSAPRRIAQLAHFRPDLRFTAIRGNVDTRLRKLADGEADALILACAGLDRLGRADAITERLPLSISLPQVGQGCIAVQCNAGDAALISLLTGVADHPPTRRTVETERAFLSCIGGGCTVPVAAHAVLDGDHITLTARIASPDGSQMQEAIASGSESVTVGTTAYEQLVESGARRLLA